MFKIGILTKEDGTLLQWQINCIESINHRSDISIEYFIPSITSRSVSKIKKNNLNVKISKFLLKKHTKYHSSVNLSDTPKLLRFSSRSNVYELLDEEIKKLKHLDVLVRFSLDILKGKILNSTKLGVLSFHHGSMKKFRGGPSGFWEILEKTKLSISLQILNSTLDGGKIVCSANFANMYNFKENRLLIYNASSLVFEKGINDLISNKDLSNNLYFYSKKLYRHPKFYDLIRCKFINLAYRLKNRIKKSQNWNIYFNKNASRFNSIPFYKSINIFDEENKVLRADPFIVAESNDSIEFIYEKLDSSTNFKGVINKASYNFKSKTIEYDIKFIEEEYHLSFPYIYKERSIILPEQRQNLSSKYYYYDLEGVKKGFIDLKYKNLTDIVLHKKNDKVYAFATQSIRGLSDSVLRLFLLDNDLNFITEHSSSPICVGQDKSRMAGRIFIHNNKTYRFFQNNLKGYGANFGVSLIEDLNENNFSEVILEHSCKYNKLSYSHHIDFGLKNILFDGKR